MMLLEKENQPIIMVRSSKFSMMKYLKVHALNIKGECIPVKAIFARIDVL